MSLIEQNFVKKVFLILGGVNDEMRKLIQKMFFFWVEIECHIAVTARAEIHKNRHWMKLEIIKEWVFHRIIL